MTHDDKFGRVVRAKLNEIADQYGPDMAFVVFMRVSLTAIRATAARSFSGDNLDRFLSYCDTAAINIDLTVQRHVGLTSAGADTATRLTRELVQAIQGVSDDTGGESQSEGGAGAQG